MTYDDYLAVFDDILEAFHVGELTQSQLEREMEMLQEQYEDECEDY